MEATEIQPWLFQVEPYDGESLSHFLGRFRRANELTPSGLGKAVGIGAAIARWEKFRFNPPPSYRELEALAAVVGVEADRNRADAAANWSRHESQSDSVVWGLLCPKAAEERAGGSLRQERGGFVLSPD